MSPRRDQQRLRAEAAEDTRRRVLDALYDRLRSAPSRPVSVDEVAQAARRGAFHDLPDLRLTRRPVRRAGGRALQDRRIRARGERGANPNARESLRDSALGGVRMFAAHRDVFRGSTRWPSSTRRPWAEQCSGSRLRARVGCHGWRRASQLTICCAATVTTEDAAHVLWLLSSFDAFDVLFTGRGLGVDEVAELLTAVAERTLCR